MRLLYRIGIDTAECFRCHVHEGGDVLFHEVRPRIVVDVLQPLAQLRFRLRQVGPHLTKRLLLIWCMAGKADVGDHRRQELKTGRSKEVVANAARAATLAHDPGRNSGYVLFFRATELSDPGQCVEADRWIAGIKDPDPSPRTLAMLRHHRRDLVRRIEHDQRTTPFERGRDCHRRRFETAGAGKDNPIG